VPKGLRAFDAQDADFFLELLPGPRDRDGLPDSLRFWKNRIELTDPDRTFSIGLMYGPSGCGKSSLVRAGLLPRLSAAVQVVFVEAAPGETEARLLRGLRRAFPELCAEQSLPQALALLRRGHGQPPGTKVLVVLDQVEQWLHARGHAGGSDLVAAMRQCDGQNVQGLLLVRDDFWIATTRLFQELEILLSEGQNSAAVDRFDLSHARKVLRLFGRAYGRLPEVGVETTAEQERFLDQAVAGLAVEGRAVPVRLSLFAEMFKGKAWTRAALREVGGAEGIGVTFLEDTFSIAAAPPAHRLHQKAARSVLSLLLPEPGTGLPVVINRVAAGAEPAAEPGMMGLWYRRDGRRIVFPAAVQGKLSRKGWDPSNGELDPTLTGIDRAKLMDEYLPYPSQFSPAIPVPTATSPDGSRLARVGAGAGGAWMPDRSKEYAKISVLVLDAATGRVLHNLVGHTADVICIAFSPDGRRIATCSDDRTVKLWDTATGRDVFTLRGHTAGVNALVFSPDGRRIVSGGNDGRVRVWDATPLPTEILQAQDARYQRKRSELEALRDNAEAGKSTGSGNNLSVLSPWDRSADELGKYIEFDPNNLPVRYLHVVALLETRNRAEIRRACEELLKRFGKTTDLAQANRVAWYCVLAPDAVEDPKALVRLAENALAAHPEGGRQRSDVLQTLGAALYRAGRFEEAVRRLDESMQTRGDGGDARGFAFLAMAHHRLGRRDEAKRWLDKLVSYRPEEGFDFSRDDVEVRILHREAESLILGSRPAAP
jgi:hypothetical protein